MDARAAVVCKLLQVAETIPDGLQASIHGIAGMVVQVPAERRVRYVLIHCSHSTSFRSTENVPVDVTEVKSKLTSVP